MTDQDGPSAGTTPTGRGPAGDRSITGRVLAVLECVAQSDGGITLTAIVRETGLPKPTAHRIATDLVRRRLLDRDASGYRLGMRVVDLGFSASKQLAVADVALPYLGELFASTKQLVFLGMLDGARVRYLERVAGPTTLLAERSRLVDMPASTTGLGKAMLAFSDPATVRSVVRRGLPARTRYSITYPRVLLDDLRNARQEGVAYDREESVLGVTCVAAPILDETGVAVAAISVCGPTATFNPQERAWAVAKVSTSISHAVRKVAASANGLNE